MCFLKGKVLHGVELAEKIQNTGLNLNFTKTRNRHVVEV